MASNSISYEKIKKYYDKGWWTKEMVRGAVEMGHITAEQYKQITGEDY